MSKRLVVGALVVDDLQRPMRVLTARRSSPPVGRWEFPGGKTESGETPQVALARELQEELQVVADVGTRLDPPGGGRWPISAALEMELWWCTLQDDVVPGDSHDEVRWVTSDEMEDFDWLEADRDALPLVGAVLLSRG